MNTILLRNILEFFVILIVLKYVGQQEYKKLTTISHPKKKIAPKKVAGEKPGTKIDDYSEGYRGILNDPAKFLEMLFTYEKDNIPDSVIQKIEPYINNEKFQPAAIQQVSKACTSICSWVRAMYKFHFVNKSVAPKREAQALAMEELTISQKKLANAKAKLKEVEEKLATLQAKYDDSVRKKADLEVKVKECEEKVIRAGKVKNSIYLRINI